MDKFGDRIYLPVLQFFLRYPLLGLGGGLAALFITVAYVKAGYVSVNPFPKTDSNQVLAQIVYPDGTPARVVDEATQRIERAARKVSEALYESDLAQGQAIDAEGGATRGPVKLTFRQVGNLTSQGPMRSANGGGGSNVGQVFVELRDATERNITSSQLINLWRKEAGEFNGAELVRFDSASMGPGGQPIEFKLLAPASHQAELDRAVEDVKAYLATFTGVYDIRDDATPGKLEFQIRVKDQAQSMGVSSADLAETIRNAYYGAEVMRLQRGRHEVKLMVRYPVDERSSLTQFSEIRVRGSDGVERPITELADPVVVRGYSEINRLDQQRAITITADLDASEANSQQIADALRTSYFANDFKEKFPAVSVDWEGQQQQTYESLFSLAIGSGLALLAMYILLVVEFRSYFQPLLIMAIIPFGIIGAVWGHAFMGLEVTLFSFFGLVALTGVVVNDSIVLVDFINHRVRAGMDQQEALLEAGRRRLRPVFLTSLTTIGGLFPMLLEKSFQAQFLVPMATSIAFGLMLSTVLVLFQVPVFFQLYLIVSQWMGVEHVDESLTTAVSGSTAESPSPMPA